MRKIFFLVAAVIVCETGFGGAAPEPAPAPEKPAHGTRTEAQLPTVYSGTGATRRDAENAAKRSAVRQAALRLSATPSVLMTNHAFERDIVEKAENFISSFEVTSTNPVGGQTGVIAKIKVDETLLAKALAKLAEGPSAGAAKARILFVATVDNYFAEGSANLTELLGHIGRHLTRNAWTELLQVNNIVRSALPGDTPSDAWSPDQLDKKIRTDAQKWNYDYLVWIKVDGIGREKTSTAQGGLTYLSLKLKLVVEPNPFDRQFELEHTLPMRFTGEPGTEEMAEVMWSGAKVAGQALLKKLAAFHDKYTAERKETELKTTRITFIGIKGQAFRKGIYRALATLVEAAPAYRNIAEDTVSQKPENAMVCEFNGTPKQTAELKAMLADAFTEAGWILNEQYLDTVQETEGGLIFNLAKCIPPTPRP